MIVLRRGDVVIADVPFTDTSQSKLRPAIVVQNDRDNVRLRKTILVIVTSNLRRQNDPSHFIIDPTSAEGASAGIQQRSLASCNNLLTIEHTRVQRVIGHLSAPLLVRLNDCLKAALEVT